MLIDSLPAFGIPPEIAESWKKNGYHSLLPIQEDALSRGVLDGKSLLIDAPTSSGKTFVGELAAVAHACRGRKTLYLVPFKAIAEEKFSDFNEKYGDESVGLKICLSDRDHREFDNDLRIGRYDIAILTYEKLNSLLVSQSGIIDTCHCVVVDEIQMISDEDRGGGLEFLLTKLKRAPNRQIIALSAVLEDLNQFDEWLGVEVVRSRARPVELRMGVLQPDGAFEYSNWNTRVHGIEQLAPGKLSDVVEYFIRCGEQVIIIRNTVKEAEGTIARLLPALAHLKAAPKTISALSSEASTETRDALLIGLRHSIAFHHSDCELAERRAVEVGFRNGEIRVLCATTTLSMGVNLPCGVVILADTYKWRKVHGSMQQVPWSAGEVVNILGRAGRLNQNASAVARGIVLAPDRREARIAKNTFFEGNLDALKSSFENRDIAFRVLDAVATGFGGSRQEISSLLFSTFAARSWTSETAKAQISAHIESAIETCLRAALFEISSTDIVRATELGKICAREGISIESFTTISGFAHGITSLDALEALFIVASVTEVAGAFYRGVKWADPIRNQRVLSRLGELDQRSELTGECGRMFSKLNGRLSERYAMQFAIALLVQDILNSKETTRALCNAYVMTGANIRNICLNVAWMLDSMAAIFSVCNPELSSLSYKLSECCNHRAPLGGFALTKLGVSVSRDECLSLLNAGYTNADDFVDKVGSDFRGVIDPAKADRIIDKILRRRERTSDHWLRDQRRRLDRAGRSLTMLDELYTATGIDLERAVAALFDTGFAVARANRVSDQRSGEPDLVLIYPSGEKMTIQVTAKEDARHFVDSKKAGDVVPQSARLSPDGYMCLGRPDFQEAAREQAEHLARQFNYKAVPLYMLAELFVRVNAGGMEASDVCGFLESVRGYVNMDKLLQHLDKAASASHHGDSPA